MSIEMRLGVGGSLDELLLLRSALNEEPEFRGRTELIERDEHGTLGGTIESILLTVGPGMTSAAAAVLITWLRSRRSNVSIKIKTSGETDFELSAKRVQTVSAKDLRKLMTDVANKLDES